MLFFYRAHCSDVFGYVSLFWHKRVGCHKTVDNHRTYNFPGIFRCVDSRLYLCSYDFCRDLFLLFSRSTSLSSSRVMHSRTISAKDTSKSAAAFPIFSYILIVKLIVFCFKYFSLKVSTPVWIRKFVNISPKIVNSVARCDVYFNIKCDEKCDC